MLDILIRGGIVVTPEGRGERDVAIAGESIVGVTAPGTYRSDVGRLIDATGKIVVPGGIDPHVHTNWPVPGPGGKRIINAPPLGVSKAALYGGTTTLVDFAVVEPEATIADVVTAKLATWADSYTDYTVHVLLHGAAPKAILEQIPETISAGYSSFKLFTTDVKPARKGLMLRFGDIWELMKIVSRHNGILAVHAEDNDIVMHLYDKFQSAGDLSYKNLPAIHNEISEDLSFRRIIRLAEYVDGATLYMMHVSAATGVDAVAEARARGLPIYAETLHNFTAFTADDYLKPDGVIYHTHPSIKHEKDRQRLWRGLKEGTISTMATDESCTPKAIKVSGQTILDTVGGQVGVETRVAIVYTEGVVKRGISLEQFVGITSTNAARLCGMYPKKGAISEGSDADITIIDPSIRRTLRAADLHDSDYSIWEGWEVHGWPAMTLLRGKVAVENGVLKLDAGAGKLVHDRKMASELQDGPRL
jgi:dihydropyrimidinase